MKQSESIAALAKALVAAQSEMGGAVKGANNPFFKSKYADLTSVVMAIKEPFHNHGLAYTQFPIRSESGVGVVTRLLHESGEWIEEEYTLPIVKNDPQAAGSAITYARRYALQSMAGIPTAEDDAQSAMMRVASVPESTMNLLSSADSIAGLQALFKQAWHEYPNNRAELTAAKDARKKDLSND